MEIVRHFPLLTIIASFVSVVLCSLLSRKKARAVTFVSEIFAITCGAFLIAYTLQSGSVIYQMGHLSNSADGTPLYWFNNVIRFGPIEALLSTVFPAVMLLCISGGIGKIEEDIKPEKEKYYYVLANLAQVALLALVYADDIFTGYVFLEISTLSSIGLIAVKDKGRTTVAAIRYMIFNLVGSGLFLIGIVLVYDMTGYFMFEKIQPMLTSVVTNGNSLPAVTCSVALITIGLGIKSGLFPFYFWMADTYGESTTASAGIISGLISKGYIFLLIKFLFRAYGAERLYETADGAVSLGVLGKTGILDIIFVLGVCGMIFGSVSALLEKRINKMIAYSSAAQIGYIYLAIGLGDVGLKAAVFQIIAHALTKPLLFISARGLINVSGHRPQFIYLRGSGKRNIPCGIGFFFGALSMIGFPCTAGFMVKYLFVEAATDPNIISVKLTLTIAAIVISTLLNTCYWLHTVITIYSPSSEKLEPSGENTAKNRFGMIFSICTLTVFIIVAGTFPGIVTVISNGLSLIGYTAV